MDSNSLSTHLRDLCQVAYCRSSVDYDNDSYNITVYYTTIEEYVLVNSVLVQVT